jgi:hypothetical protein
MKSTLKNLLIILVIISPAILFAQDDERLRSNQIKISPAMFSDPANPGIEISYEKRHTERYASQFSVALLRSFIPDLSFDDFSGFKIAFEEKYFRKKKYPESKANPFLSGQLSYINVKYTDYNEFIQDTALITPAYYDTFRVAKQTLSLNVKAGLQIAYRRFVLEFSGGIGLKYKMINRSELFDVNAYQTPTRHPNVFAIASQPGNYFTLSVPLNVTIGYRF